MEINELQRIWEKEFMPRYRKFENSKFLHLATWTAFKGEYELALNNIG